MEPAPSSERIPHEMDRAFAEMQAASARMLRWTARFDASGLWARQGVTSMTGWLASRYGVSRGTAREWVRVAHALEELPRIADAYERGRLSWDQIKFLTRFVSPETDAEWARKGPAYAPDALWVEARRHERQSCRRAEEIQRRRHLQMWWDHESPIFHLRGDFGAEQGARIEAACSRRMESIPPDPDAHAPAEAQAADALESLVTEGRGETASADGTTLVVHADAVVLAGHEPSTGPSLAETATGQRLAQEAVRRLACDARIEWLLESDGRPVGIGRRGRTVPGPIRRALYHRDRGCVFPGCGHRRWTDAHHIVHWADGGETVLDNLVVLCRGHHRRLHDGGWRMEGIPGVSLRFFGPRGRPIPTRVAELFPDYVGHRARAPARAGPAA